MGEIYVDGNVLAGALQTVFAVDVTVARGRCAGCGHTDGGTPTTLRNSHAVLEVPDCARFRADGTNEVRGIRPDVLIGWRKMDGRTRRAADFAAMLPAALQTAETLDRKAR